MNVDKTMKENPNNHAVLVVATIENGAPIQQILFIILYIGNGIGIIMELLIGVI